MKEVTKIEKIEEIKEIKTEKSVDINTLTASDSRPQYIVDRYGCIRDYNEYIEEIRAERC